MKHKKGEVENLLKLKTIDWNPSFIEKENRTKVQQPKTGGECLNCTQRK